MRFFLIVSIFCSFLFSEKLIIDANKFETYDEKGLSIFTGNVKMVRGKDELESDRLDVYLSEKKVNTKREPLKYIAIGNVKFKLITIDKIYEGKGDKVVFNPKSMDYIITGNGFIKELNENKKLFGDKIIINQVTGEAKVSGSDDKPVRFIIDLADNSTKKEDKEPKTTQKVESK